MDERPWSHVTDEQRETAHTEFMEALEKYMRTVFADDTMQVFGHILQVSGTGVLSGEVLTWDRSGSRTEKLGLLSLLTANLESTCIPQLEVNEGDDDE